MFNFKENDTYKIKRSQDNFKIDRKVLLRLYQPLIGASATSLYMTLDSDIGLYKSSKDGLVIQNFINHLKIDINQFNSDVDALKKVNLLSYRQNAKKENDYLFKISLPLNAKDFFNNESLFNEFKNSVDESYLSKITHYFITTAIDEDEYVDVDESKKELSENEFYVIIVEKYPILKDAINDKLKKEVKRLKSLFNLTYDTIELAIFNSIDYENNKLYISLDKLNDYVEANFKIEEKKKDKWDSFVETLENTPPLEYYFNLFKRTLLPSEERAILKVKEKYNLSTGLFNSCTYYYYQYGNKDYRNSTGYLDKLAASLVASNCTTIKEALNCFKEYRENYSKQQAKSYEIKKQEKPKVEEKVIVKRKEVEVVTNNSTDEEDQVYAQFLDSLGE